MHDLFFFANVEKGKVQWKGVENGKEKITTDNAAI